MVVLTINVTHRIVNYMISGKEFALQLEKFLKSPVCQNARIQVKLPRGEYKSPDGFFDIKKIYLLQNNLIGAIDTLLSLSFGADSL